jgi:hypothetical protein
MWLDWLEFEGTSPSFGVDDDEKDYIKKYQKILEIVKIADKGRGKKPEERPIIKHSVIGKSFNEF